MTRSHTSANRLKKALAGRVSAEELSCIHLLVDNGSLELGI